MKSILFLRALAVLVICGVRKWQGACRRPESTRQRHGTARRAADSCGTQYASFDVKSTRPSHWDAFVWPGAWPRERVCATAPGPAPKQGRSYGARKGQRAAVDIRGRFSGRPKAIGLGRILEWRTGLRGSTLEPEPRVVSCSLR